MPVDYLQKILTAKVYDVAIESPLEWAAFTSIEFGPSVNGSLSWANERLR